MKNGDETPVKTAQSDGRTAVVLSRPFRQRLTHIQQSDFVDGYVFAKSDPRRSGSSASGFGG